jgi:hypothetical protein
VLADDRRATHQRPNAGDERLAEDAHEVGCLALALLEQHGGHVLAHVQGTLQARTDKTGTEARQRNVGGRKGGLSHGVWGSADIRYSTS